MLLSGLPSLEGTVLLDLVLVQTPIPGGAYYYWWKLQVKKNPSSKVFCYNWWQLRDKKNPILKCLL